VIERVRIAGAGGRDFHVFNTCFRDEKDALVVAFTAAQIPHIDDRTYPTVLAGPRYPQGIPIRPEEELEAIIEAERVHRVVFAGADYERILREAEKEADIVVWDGGNNDLPFIRPDLAIVLLDPLRAGDELRYFPGRENLERADVLPVVKTDSASEDGIDAVEASARKHNPGAALLRGRSPIELDGDVRGKRVLVVEDGPTTMHGGMPFGAGTVAARNGGAGEIVDPRPFAQGAIREAYDKYPHLEAVVPALGYSDEDVRELEATIAAADCDAVVIGTPIDLARIVKIDKPVVRATYGFEGPGLGVLLRDRFRSGTA